MIKTFTFKTQMLGWEDEKNKITLCHSGVETVLNLNRVFKQFTIDVSLAKKGGFKPITFYQDMISHIYYIGNETAPLALIQYMNSLTGKRRSFYTLWYYVYDVR